MYYQAITKFGDYFALLKNVWSMMVGMVPSMMAIFIVQYIWIIRIWTVNHGEKRTFLAAIQGTIVLVDFGVACGWVGQTWTSEDILSSNPWLALVAIMLVTFTDLVNCSTLTYLLWRTRNGLVR
ncbi:hypothetical protein PUNSTDRAFT_135162 [Punctularia strigosozonata HHB-11173 SS5]|uniref:uncharacterized protein n=1 Tax=Punctularia strigosozonata (strain HHB-11173) TaxID=741275 RepID=UPI00044176A9|nr:uncharacterized protein PUNSTDRAFT_135162 [Punctularia strigosozonata HHB-11173 SS5]EIN07644.1 hypothetical protein PUNSTDRAFT_135162 [Punctularia strigosozonata HHB-11173 SS5]